MGDEASAPYPAHWEADVVLRDGSTMHIRPIRPDDADALQRFHVRQSPESTYFRFFAPLARLSDRDLARLTRVDHDERVALVLVSGGEIVAVGRYDRLDAARAEVAFNVADALQGHGLGSVLLEHLAAAARERGIRRFVADVLPGNARMINVFRDAGYDVRQSYDDGVIAVGFDIDPTERSLAVMAEREHRADARSMQTLLGASSVVVVAEGEREARFALRVARSVEASPFSGAVHLVRADTAGTAGPVPDPVRDDGPRVSVHVSLRAVPGPVDLAVVAAPANRLPAIAREVADLGARGLVVLSGGFGETGPAGALLQAELLRAARDGGMRLVGPQSFGLVASGAAGRLDATLWPDLPPPGGLGLFCQSAAAGLALLAATHRRRIGLRTFLSAGHRADVSGNDAMQFWADDDATRVAAVYLESIGNPRKFTRVARRLSALKPVVAVVSGQTGQVVPPGHPVRTSREPRRVLEELLRQAGVVRVESTHAMLDVAQLLESQPLPTGERVAILTNSGSLSSLLGEVARARGLAVAGEPAFLEADAGSDAYEAALERLSGQTDWDSLVVAYLPVLGDADARVGAVVAAAAARTGRTTAACIFGLHGLADELTHRGEDSVTRVPAFASGEDAVAALAAAARYARWVRADRGTPVAPTGIDHRAALELVRTLATGLPGGGSVVLDRARTTEVLGHYGIALWPAETARTAEEAVEAARRFGGPVAVKTADPRRRHRLDLGGVRLDVAGDVEVRDAVAHLTAAAGEEGGSVEVQPMAPLGVACVIRAREDELYGPVVSFGLAGDAVDLLGDVAHGIPPLTDVDVREIVRSVHAAPRLFGAAGAPPVDVHALEDLLARVAVLGDDLPDVANLVLDPVLVAEEGLAVLGARIELARPARSGAQRRSLPG